MIHTTARMLKYLLIDVAQEVDLIGQRSHFILQICLHQVGGVNILNAGAEEEHLTD